MDGASFQTWRWIVLFAKDVCIIRGADWIRKESIYIWSYHFFCELPQALFQLSLLCLGKTSDTAIVTLSVGISLSSLFLQIIQLRAVAKKESYPSIFSLVEALSRGDFISGVNKIKENTSSILNVTFPTIIFISQNLNSWEILDA